MKEQRGDRTAPEWTAAALWEMGLQADSRWIADHRTRDRRLSYALGPDSGVNVEIHEREPGRSKRQATLVYWVAVDGRERERPWTENVDKIGPLFRSLNRDMLDHPDARWVDRRPSRRTADPRPMPTGPRRRAAQRRRNRRRLRSR